VSEDKRALVRMARACSCFRFANGSAMGRGRASRYCELGNETLRGERVLAHGPSLVLSAKAAQNFALAIHELATNAAKYGLFQLRQVESTISWSISKTNGIGQFSFRWEERGAPAVLRLARRVLEAPFSNRSWPSISMHPPRIDFASGGVSYELSGSLDSVNEQAAASWT
jgi:hypothetical protein